MTPPCLLPGELPPLAWGGSPHHMGLKDFMGKQAHGRDQVSWAIPSCQGLGQKLQHHIPSPGGSLSTTVSSRAPEQAWLSLLP